MTKVATPVRGFWLREGPLDGIFVTWPSFPAQVTQVTIPLSNYGLGAKDERALYRLSETLGEATYAGMWDE